MRGVVIPNNGAIAERRMTFAGNLPKVVHSPGDAAPIGEGTCPDMTYGMCRVVIPETGMLANDVPIHRRAGGLAGIPCSNPHAVVESFLESRPGISGKVIALPFARTADPRKAEPEWWSGCGAECSSLVRLRKRAIGGL